MTTFAINDPAGPASHPPENRRRDWVAIGTLTALLLGTAALYIWGLDRSGWANSFYSAAAQAGGQDWTAWFFGSSDAGNSITVDKPPAAMWLMGLSVRIFGLSSWSILVPEALLGVASVGVLYASLRRTVLHGWPALPLPDSARTPASATRFAHWTALAGAATFALTPVATLMFRFNNPDALLVFCLTLAGYLTLRATENASRRWLVLAGVAVGFGFLTKMLQAFLVLPVFVLVYLIATRATWTKKLVDLLAAFAAVVVSAGWYVAVVELMPTSLRPYIGGSQNNSIIELFLGYNGLGRITGTEVGSVGGGQRGPGVGEESLLRMFTGVSGGMVSWLIPAALVLGCVALVLLGRTTHALPDAEADAVRQLRGGVALWLGWLVVTAAVFSFMGGIYHDYYTVALAPGIAGSVALAGAVLWAHRSSVVARTGLAVSSLASSGWAFALLQQAGGAYLVLGWGVLAVGVIAAAGLIAGPRLPGALASASLVAALAAGLAGPAAYAVNTAATPHTGSIVTAGPVQSFGGRMGAPDGMGGMSGPDGMGGPYGMGMPGGQRSDGRGQPGSGQQPPEMGAAGGDMGGLLNGASVSSEVEALLNTDASSYTWVAAAIGSQNAASYQLATEHAVMAIGGFNGTDPSPTLEQFQALVANGKIHYFLGGAMGGQANGGSQAASEIATWVEQNYTATTVGGSTIYDLTTTK